MDCIRELSNLVERGLGLLDLYAPIEGVLAVCVYMVDRNESCSKSL